MTQNDDIPKGYKGSPVGVIPEDWEVKKLGEVLFQLSSFSFSREQMTAQPQALRCIHYGDIHIAIEKDSVNLNQEELPFLIDGIIDEVKLEAENFPYLNNGDIILADASEDYAGIGKSWELLELDYKKVIAGLHTIALRDISCSIAIGYGRYLLKNFQSAKALKRIAQGTKVYSISYTHISRLPIILPPLPEQQKIAEIISLWDEAIEKQSALIVRLTQRKQALMQQLLTGKKRLKGLEEEWKVKTLGELGEISSAGVDKKLIEGETPVRLLNYLDVYRRDFIYANELNHWVTASKDKLVKCSIKKGDIFFTPSSEVSNDIGISAVSMEDIPDAVYSYHIVRLRLHENWDIKYCAYAFKTDEFYKQAETWCDGSGQRYVISLSNFRKIKIQVPPLEEQIAIADILSTADQQIDLAKKKLAAFKEQKKGLMQQLLTGKKRVKI